jgi:integrase
MQRASTRNEGPKITERTLTVKGHEYVRYTVDFGTVDGRRNRRTFKSEADAQTAIAKEAVLSKRIGRQARKLGDDELLDAAKALDVLQHLVTLETCAVFWMEHNRPDGGKRTVQEAVTEFLQSRRDKGCRPITVDGYGDKLGLFGREMNGRNLAHTTVAVLETWLKARGFSPESRTSYLRTLRAFFGWAMKRRYIGENPAQAIDMPKVDRKRVTYLGVEDCERLLRTTETERPELVPYVALAMFAGLRPSEIHGEKTGHAPLDWRCIHFDKALLDIEPGQTKTRDGRHVPMSPNLAQWLLPRRQEHGPVFYNRSAFLGVLEKSGVPYSKDILRHTCGTYLYARTRHEGETAIQLGDTIKTVKKHYINPRVEQADAARFWAIVPRVEGNVVKFATAAG